MKKIPILLLLILPLAALAADVQAPAAGTDTKTVTLYYFHRTQRCAGCRNAEAKTFEAAKETFAAQIEKGRLILKSVAVDGAADEKKVAEEFGAFGPSVFLAFSKDGKNEKIALDKMWDKLREGEGAYKVYIIENLKKYLP